MKTSCKVFVLFISLNEEAVVLAPSNQKKSNFDTFSNICVKTTALTRNFTNLFYSKSLERDDVTTHVLTDIYTTHSSAIDCSQGT
jgi:hypothetical protein